jgi:PAS domain S-box-containing protein
LIRKRPKTEFTPIIFVTSVMDSVNQMYRGYSIGAVDYILTPIVPEVLRAKVSVFVELYQKTQQIREQGERLRRIEEAEHRRRLAEAVDRLEVETKRNRFFNLSVDLLGIANFDGYLLQVNPSWEKTLGYNEYELKTFSCLDLVHADDRQAMEQQMHVLKNGTNAIYFEARYRCKPGGYRWLGWTAAPFAADQLIYIFARDITARKHAEDRITQLNAQLQQRVTALTEVNKELEAFNYSISHDLRAPLRSMQSFAQALLEDPENKLTDESNDFARRIVRSGRYMDALLRDLLAYSRLSRLELVLSTIDLEVAVRDVIDQLQKDIREKHAVIDVQSPLGLVRGHVPTLNQILANLIGNALKFTAPGKTPSIQVTGENRGDRVRLWIKDNGIGIAPEHFERIFGLFERLHSPQEYPGTGIGLALVRKAIERMAGAVGVESEAGKGSRFWIELPLADTTGHGHQPAG